ncbi:MAG: magnesium/cobalt transporter CorA [bacterium]
MVSLYRRRTKKVGLPPGTLVHVGERKADEVRIELIDFGPDHWEERLLDSVEECEQYFGRDSVTWINIDGLHEVETIQQLGEHLQIHPLVQEDIVHTEQRPKMEEYDGYLFLVARMLSLAEISDPIVSEQVSFILGEDFLITFQERHGDSFEPVRDRLRAGKGRIRRSGPGYLCYALLDAVVDHYFTLLEDIGEHLEQLEDELMSDPDQETVREIHRLKREILGLRRAVWPLREVMAGLERSETDLIADTTRTFLRDVYDHTIQVIDTVETFRDMLGGMLDLYLSSVSNRMNEVMKVLTIIATIFIPLTFLAGIYGMNFEYMPELGWRPAYFVLLGIMAVLGLVMVAFFRRKRWL